MKKHRESGVALITTILILFLMSVLLVGFSLVLMTDLRLSGYDARHSQAWYGAEAGMEKLTNDLALIFSTNPAPSAALVNNLMNSPPNIQGVQYKNPDNSNGYSITFLPDPVTGNPSARIRTIPSGPFQGLVGMLTPYTLTVTTRTTSAGGEVRLQRFAQTAAIPVFQFGIFSETDLSFFAGPNFNFGGRVHTNGNLFLAEGGASTLTMGDRVTAFGEVVRAQLANGRAITSTGHTGTVNITTGPGTFRPLAGSEGSVTGGLGSPLNASWVSPITGYYNGNLRNYKVGVTRLNLPFVTLGAQPIDLIRRPVPGEVAGILGQRYFAQASLRVLLSDIAADITNLPCIDTTVAPLQLDNLTTGLAASPLPSWYTSGNPTPVPLAKSSAGIAYNPADGYWIQNNSPTISGFIKIEIQTAYGTPCGTWKDVTQEVLKLGIAGKNINPDLGGTMPNAPTLPTLPGAAQPPSPCAEVNPNAVIRLERIRDNPSNKGADPCGLVGGFPPNPSDYWPNVLFDTREGNLRDICLAGVSPCSTPPSLLGVMHYIELDVNNLAKYLTGGFPGTSGTQAKDTVNAFNDFLVYFSDRRGNHNGNPSAAGNETGEFGFGDFLNPADPYGCPNGVLDQGEDVAGVGGTPKTYGATAVWPANSFGSAALVAVPVITPHPNCTLGSLSTTPWPGWYYAQAQDARENPPLFFRRALKIVNGNKINLGNCPNGVVCGLTIVSENPAYVQGDYNANSAVGGFNDPHVAAAVIADTLSFLSGNWNDVNSFAFPYDNGFRSGQTSWYRMGIVAGKGINFPQPTGYSTPADYGTDGGVHNFLRYLENWAGTLNYRGSIVSLYYNRQGVGVYKCCTTVYSPPTRAYNFDVEFLTPTLLPPRTPMFRDVNTTGFQQLILSGQ